MARLGKYRLVLTSTVVYRLYLWHDDLLGCEVRSALSSIFNDANEGCVWAKHLVGDRNVGLPRARLDGLVETVVAVSDHVTD